MRESKFIYYMVSLLAVFALFNIENINSQNLVTNGGFEDGTNGWENLSEGGSSATFSVLTTGSQEGTNHLSCDLQTLGTNDWSVQSMSSTFTTTPGEKYKLTFYAKTNVAGQQLRTVLQNSSYSAQDYTITDTWTMYSWEFTPTEASLQLKFHYFQTGIFYIDDIQIVAVPPSTDNAPPSCVLTAPHMNAYFQSGTDITINAYSADFGANGPEGTVSKVEFFNGDTKIGESTSATNNTFTFVWEDAQEGTYTITAKATDNLDVVFTSAGVIIQVGTEPAAAIGLSTNKGKYLANIISWHINDGFMDYWNGVTAENSCKWGSVEGTRDQMNWTNADLAYNYAKDNHLPFRYHAFAWGNQYPDWITSLTPAEFQAEMEEYIAAVAARYPYIDQIDVLNEQLGTHAEGTKYFRDGLGGTGVTGYDWQIWLFKKAREYFPNAKLVLNDYGLANDANAINQQLNLVAILRDSALIDGFGTQSHYFNVDQFSSSPAALEANLDLMATSGVPIYVTELDLIGESKSESSQLASYQNVFPVYWEHPAVAGVTLWGYIEGQTWEPGTGILNSNGTERSAMTWLKTYMKDQENVGYPFGVEAGTTTDRLADIELESIKLFPNPTDGLLTIKNKGSKAININITNSLGQNIDYFALKAKSFTQKNLNKGLYIVSAGNKNYKVIVE